MLAARHAPAPSQTRASVAIVVPVGQDGAPHWVPAEYSSHPPAPSQRPVCPQLIAPSSRHTPTRSVPPSGTGEHVPPLPATAHERQLAVQAVLQHTPCAQNPLRHSTSPAHTAPGGFSP